MGPLSTSGCETQGCVPVVMTIGRLAVSGGDIAKRMIIAAGGWKDVNRAPTCWIFDVLLKYLAARRLSKL